MWKVLRDILLLFVLVGSAAMALLEQFLFQEPTDAIFYLLVIVVMYLHNIDVNICKKNQS